MAEAKPSRSPEEAAVAVQAAVRGYLTRKSLKAKASAATDGEAAAAAAAAAGGSSKSTASDSAVESRPEAVEKVAVEAAGDSSSNGEAKVAAAAESKPKLNDAAAATEIQGALRGLLARRELARLKAQHDAAIAAAATEIQRALRGYLMRCRLAQHRAQRDAAAAAAAAATSARATETTSSPAPSAPSSSTATTTTAAASSGGPTTSADGGGGASSAVEDSQPKVEPVPTTPATQSKAAASAGERKVLREEDRVRRVNDLKERGNTAYASREFEKALELYSAAVELDPSNHLLYSNRSAAFMGLNRFDEALEDINRTIMLKKDWARGYGRKAAIYWSMQEYALARDNYQLALRHDANNSTYVTALKETEEKMTSLEREQRRKFEEEEQHERRLEAEAQQSGSAGRPGGKEASTAAQKRPEERAAAAAADGVGGSGGRGGKKTAKKVGSRVLTATRGDSSWSAPALYTAAAVALVLSVVGLTYYRSWKGQP